MRNPAGVSGGEATGNLVRDSDRFCNRHRATRDAFLQRLALVKGHGKEHAPVFCLTDFVDRRDRRVIQRGCRSCFDHEPAAAFALQIARGRDQLESHEAIQLGIVPLVDHGHAPLADLLDDVVAPDAYGHGYVDWRRPIAFVETLGQFVDKTSPSVRLEQRTHFVAHARIVRAEIP